MVIKILEYMALHHIVIKVKQLLKMEFLQAAKLMMTVHLGALKQKK